MSVTVFSRQMRAALRAVEDAVGALSADVVGRPHPNAWSIAEILEHLTLSFTANAAALEKVLASGTLRARRPTLRQRLGRILVIDAGYFPRVQAPEATRPRGSIAPARSVAALRDALVHLDAVMTRVAERFGDRVAVANHPYFAGLSIAQWRKFHWRHTLHHMRQVRSRSSADV